MNEYAKAASNNARNLAKAAQVLVGICSGIVADGKISDEELAFLRQWLHEHSEIAAVWPGEMIARRIEEVMEDGIVTADEHEDLLTMLQEIAGNFFVDTGVAQQAAPALPIEEDPMIEFAGRTMCFTGKFLFGTREACEQTISNLGGVPEGTVTKRLDYLVIGAFANSDWANTTYGRKIEKAVAYRSEHGRPLIISEQQWVDAQKLK